MRWKVSQSRFVCLIPPLHEFLPRGDDEIRLIAESLGSNVAVVRAKAESLHESNPMLGHRGCRLGISYPEIYAMQVRAIAEAASEAVEIGLEGRAGKS